MDVDRAFFKCIEICFRQYSPIRHHNRDIGVFHDDRMVVLGLGKTAEFYHGNPRTDSQKLNHSPDVADFELERDATAMFQVADEVYLKEQYNLRATPVPKPAAR